MGCCAWCAMCSTFKGGLSLMRKVMSLGLSSIRRHRLCVGSVPPCKYYSRLLILPLIWAKLRSVVIECSFLLFLVRYVIVRQRTTQFTVSYKICFCLDRASITRHTLRTKLVAVCPLSRKGFGIGWSNRY